MPGAGLEPARPEGHPILSPPGVSVRLGCLWLFGSVTPFPWGGRPGDLGRSRSVLLPQSCPTKTQLSPAAPEEDWFAFLQTGSRITGLPRGTTLAPTSDGSLGNHY